MRKFKVYERTTRIVPKKYMKKIQGLLISSGIKVTPEKWIGFFHLFSIALSVGVLLDGILFGQDFYLMLAISVFVLIGINAVSYVALILLADKRVRFIEHMLPSALVLMSSNIKSGMIPSQAMLVSARKEFGPLKEEMRITSNEVIGGKSFEQALTNMAKRVNSETLSRTASLLIEGSRAGGEIATLLEGIAEDIKHTELVRAEIRASVMMYVIFIFIAAGIAAPMLFAVSIFLVTMISQFGAVDVPELATAAGVPTMTISLGQVSPEFLTIFALISIAITSFFGSLIIGLIEGGEEKKGIKYIPLLLILGIVVFYFANILVKEIFGSVVV